MDEDSMSDSDDDMPNLVRGVTDDESSSDDDSDYDRMVKQRATRYNLRQTKSRRISRKVQHQLTKQAKKKKAKEAVLRNRAARRKRRHTRSSVKDQVKIISDSDSDSEGFVKHPIAKKRAVRRRKKSSGVKRALAQLEASYNPDATKLLKSQESQEASEPELVEAVQNQVENP